MNVLLVMRSRGRAVAGIQNWLEHSEFVEVMPVSD